MTITQKIYTLFLIFISQFLKIKTWFFLLFKKKRVIKVSSETPVLIVSLTSYGRRLKSCAPYAIMSIIKQKEVNIDKIILTLDKNKWTPENIPWIIKRLLKLGIDILFVDDIKSYTKIIPVLSLYKNSSIVSVDDDIYYSSNLIKTLYNGHLLFPDKIIAVKALIPEIKQNKIAASYIFWKEAIYGYTVSYIMPLGVRGVLYPPGAFVEEVFNQSVFMKLAPTNDDLWLWIMALVSKTKHHLIDSKDINVYPFDAFYQLLRKDSALFKINHKGTTNKTDEQLQALMDYCKLSLPYIE